MRLLITGARGMLGSAIQDCLKDDFEIIAASHNDLDILDYAGVKKYVQSLRPEIIIHAAAFTNVEAAEQRPDECCRINYNGTLNLINACNNLEHKFIYISSTGCYGSYKGSPYAEYDELKPTTLYHKSKVLGEKIVQNLCSSFLILRTGWLFGGSTEHKKNFVYNRFKEAKNKEAIISDPFQVGNPTNTKDVANQTKILLDENIKGVYNIVSEGSCSRFDYVKAIIEMFGLNCQVLPAEQPFERLAKVSHNEAAVNFNLDALGLNRMPNWKDSLKGYIESIKTYV